MVHILLLIFRILQRDYMSFILTYDTLKTQFISAIQRDDQDNLIKDSFDRWVAQAHARIMRDSKTLLFKVVVGGNFIVGQSVYLKPARWQTDLNFWYGTDVGFTNYQQVILRSYDYCRIYSPNATILSPPLYYNNQYNNNNWLVVPTPDQAYPFEISYMENAQVIDESYQSNYLTEFMPDVLMAAVLAEGALDLHTQDLIDSYEKKYTVILSSWNAMNATRTYSEYSSRGDD